MSTRAARRFPRRLNSTVFDWALAGVFTLIAQSDVWITGFVGGSKPVNTLTLLVATVALAWRRRTPLLSAALVMVGVAAQALLTGEAPLSLAVSGPVFIAAYSVAAYGERWDALVGIAMTAAAVAIHDINAPEIQTAQDVDDQWFWWLAILAAWIVGLYARRHRQARALEDLAVRLEREREEQARAAAARERARVARELHDVVAHGVGLIALQAGAAQETLDTEPGRARERLAAIEGTARDAAVELRRLLGVLRRDEEAPERAPQPNLGDLERLVEALRAADVTIELRIEGVRQTLPAGVELSAYRIVQEALTNAIKHADPDQVTVVVRYESDELELEITDDGRGKARADEDGFGLTGMRERVALHGGELQAGRNGGTGYVVRARLPREQP